MSISKRGFVLSGFALSTLLWLPPAYADGVLINTDENNLAIQGYDTVAYFTVGHPEKGSADNEVMWRGARWWFATQANRDRFSASPESYAPQFGGFCALGMALGQKLKADPQAWVIVDGKLYMNYNKEVLTEMSADIPGNFAKAERNWKTLQPQN